MERLSSDDRMLLMADRMWPQDVGVVAILEGTEHAQGAQRAQGTEHIQRSGRTGFPIELALEALGPSIGRVPRLRQVLRTPRPGHGGPYWTDAPHFDLRDHVRVTPVSGRGEEGDLLTDVELIRRRRLDPARPLWEVWILPGLVDGRVGLFVRMHHVMADGVAGIATLARLLADPVVNAPDEVAAWTPQPPPSNRQLVADNLRDRAERLGRGVRSLRHPAQGWRALRSAAPAIRELVAAEPGPLTSLAGLVGPHRSLELVRAEMTQVTEVARANGATVNDVLLAMIAGGVRALLASRGERVAGLELPVFVPVSLRGPAARRTGEMGHGNQISQMVVPLPVGLDDPVARLHAIAASTTERKAITRPLLGPVFRSRLVSAAMLRLIVRERVNLLSADLLGPSSPLSFAGLRVLEVYPLINLLGNVTLGVGALSYAGGFDVLVVGDADIHPDLDVLAAAAADEVHLLSGELVR